MFGTVRLSVGCGCWAGKSGVFKGGWCAASEKLRGAGVTVLFFCRVVWKLYYFLEVSSECGTFFAPHRWAAVFNCNVLFGGAIVLFVCSVVQDTAEKRCDWQRRLFWRRFVPPDWRCAVLHDFFFAAGHSFPLFYCIFLCQNAAQCEFKIFLPSACFIFLFCILFFLIVRDLRK